MPGSEMIETPTFLDQVESVRPPGAAKRETKALFLTALRFRDGLDDCLEGIESDAFLLDEGELDELAIALTELAEDLHADAGLWRSLEVIIEIFSAFHFRFCANPVISRSRHSTSAVFSFFSTVCGDIFYRITSFPRSIAGFRPSPVSQASISPRLSLYSLNGPP